MPFNPFIGASLIGLGGSLLSGIMGSANAEANIEFQREENEKNRQFNALQSDLQRQFDAEEAQKSRDYNTQMVNEANAYQAPDAMMERLKNAGLNPNLVYGDISSGLSIGVGSTSQQAHSTPASYSTGISPVPYQFPDLGKTIAETRLLNAQADNLDAQRGMTEKEIQRYDEIVNGNLRLTNMNVEVGESVRNWNEGDKVRLAKVVEEIDVNIQKAKQDMAYVAQQEKESYERTLGLLLDNKLKDATFDSAVTQFAAQAHLSVQEASLYTRTVLSHLMVEASQASLNGQLVKESRQKIENMVQEFNRLGQETENLKKLGVKLGYENGMLSFDYLDKKRHYYNTRSGSKGDVLDFFNYLGECIDNVVPSIIKLK